MKTPTDVRWDKEVVYEAIWSLLCAIDKHDRSAPHDTQIRTILMAPLATGNGAVSATKWAIRPVLALKHFSDALKNPQAWSSLSLDLNPEFGGTQEAYLRLNISIPAIA